ncbi:hypothetical protein Ahy_B03g062098 [Arachis hypogaea]|uniref:Protein FAR1-RELATED SEQUENCE n=1 Tax=Arachis hypogaea TaxID=3818 RepID=A0A444ZT00_ARAHY|nr:hypothetical protein Ahy_B03g062098 [Arachis hypogaea]
MKKLPSKLGGDRRYRDLYDDLNDIMWNSWTEESFEDNWSEFIDEYKLHNNTWLSGELVAQGITFLEFAASSSNFLRLLTSSTLSYS